MEPIQMPIYPILRPEDDWNTIDIDRNRFISFTDIYHDPEHPARIKTNVCSQGVDFIEEDGCFEMNVPLLKDSFDDFFYHNLDDPVKGEYYSNQFMDCWWRIKVIPPAAERDVGFEQSKGGIMLCFIDKNGVKRTRSINDFGVWTEICLIIVDSVRGFLKRKDLMHMLKTSFSETEHMYMEIPNPLLRGEEYYMCLFRKEKLIKDDPTRTSKRRVPLRQRQWFKESSDDELTVEDDGMVPNGEDL